MKNEKPNKAKNLETILTVCVVLMLIFLISERHLLAGSHKKILITISILLGLIGMFSDYLSAKFTWAWMKLAEGMGFVMNKVILSIVFFVFLLPIAVLSRVIGGKNYLQLKRRGETSYYFTRNHKYESKDLENTW